MDFWAHFPVIDAHATCAVELEFTAVIKLGGEKPLHLLDATLVGAFCFHNLIENSDVQRYHGNCRAGLRDQRFIDGDEGPPVAVRRELGVDSHGGALEVNLRGADRAVFVDGPSMHGSNVGIGHGGSARSQQLGVSERLNPHLPIFATHDGDGIRSLYFSG